jgi:hypothetical protein
MDNNIETERELASIKSDVKNMMVLLVDIKDELKNMNQNYVPRTEINEMLRGRDEKIKKLEDNYNSSKQLTVSWVAVFVSIMAFIATFVHK